MTPAAATLTLLIPCYNEASTVDRTLDAVEALALYLACAAPPIQVEVLAVDDASSDGTADRLLSRQAIHREAERMSISIVRHTSNRGKGGAIRTAQTILRERWAERSAAAGSLDVVAIQDADLEYDPMDVPRLIAPILEGRADAVIGSRFVGGGEHRVLYFWHRVANAALTLLSNMLTNLNLTDMEAGYKAFTADAFAGMHLTSERFGIEPELVARLAQMGARIYEVPISYHGRTYAEGKKITWRDGVAALWHILRAHFSSGSQAPLARDGI